MDTCHILPINAETLAVLTLNFNIYLQYCPWAFSIKYFCSQTCEQTYYIWYLFTCVNSLTV